ncbi:MAG: SDR family NAD(P)-dependent oxidoreductase [Gammaproteobacteria bacterium]|nr:SDR family NAD(P)-dependent oxidoreductase [Gammaproteobacteria bacterium]
MKLLQGKTILITGAGRGVGRAIALAAAEAGANVAVNDIGVSLRGEYTGDSPAHEVVKEITAAGGNAIALTDSVGDWDAAHSMIETTVKAFGSIDGVINNAGNLRDVIFHKMTEEDFDAVINVHLKGSFNMSRAAAPYFKTQGGGAFLHMTSTSGLVGNFGQANYCAAKLGIVGMSKAIALDMERFGVRSNAVAPFAWTRMVGSIPTDTPEQQKRVEGLKKLVPERLAPFAVAMCSDQAKHVSGQVFGVRNNEIYLFSQSRPIRTAHTADGWTPETVIERVLPMFENDFYPLHRSGDVFTWDPV